MSVNRPVKSDETLFAIIDAIRARDAAGVTELAEHLDMAKGSVHHHLSTMEEHGYVAKEDGVYRLGLQFFVQGMHVRSSFPLFEAAKDTIVELGEETGEAGWCFVEEGGRGMFIGGYADHRSINEDAVVGSWRYLHCCATGKAILANMAQEEIDAVIKRHGLPAMTDHTITDREPLMAELEATRERGYALNLKEDLDGMHAVGVPIHAESELVGSIGVGGAANRLPEEYCEETLAPAVITAANEIQLNLVYQ